MIRRRPVLAGIGTALTTAALAAVLTANGHAVAAPGGTPPTTTTTPITMPPRLSIGVMMDPPVPGYAVAAAVDPAMPPYRWHVVAGGNSAGLGNMAVRTGDRTYVVWAAGIHPGGRATVDAGCTITGKAASPAPFSGTDLTVVCAARTNPFSLTYRA
jgi:hypothetical protein